MAEARGLLRFLISTPEKTIKLISIPDKKPVTKVPGRRCTDNMDVWTAPCHRVFNAYSISLVYPIARAVPARPAVIEKIRASDRNNLKSFCFLNPVE